MRQCPSFTEKSCVSVPQICYWKLIFYAFVTMIALNYLQITNFLAPLLLVASRACSTDDWCLSGCPYVVKLFQIVTLLTVFLWLSRNLAHIFSVPLRTKLEQMFEILLFPPENSVQSVDEMFVICCRLFFVGSREGHMPEVLCFVQVKRLTPAPAVIFMVQFARYLPPSRQSFMSRPLNSAKLNKRASKINVSS